MIRLTCVSLTRHVQFLEEACSNPSLSCCSSLERGQEGLRLWGHLMAGCNLCAGLALAAELGDWLQGFQVLHMQCQGKNSRFIFFNEWMKGSKLGLISYSNRKGSSPFTKKVCWLINESILMFIPILIYFLLCTFWYMDRENSSFPLLLTSSLPGAPILSYRGSLSAWARRLCNFVVTNVYNI